MPKKEHDWWNEFFPKFRFLFSFKKAAINKVEISYVIKKLNLKKGSTFLDCPVGIGRIAIPLAKKGIKVTGVDITPSYLTELEEKASKAKLPIKLFHLDMRKISFENQFDAAANLWTSIGYFEKESDNLLVIKKIFKALKPGGKFILQVINRDWIIRRFEATGWESIGDVKLLKDRNLNYEKSLMEEKWIFLKGGEEEVIETKIRLYSLHEMIAMFEKAGFVNIESFGSTKDEPVSYDSRDMFVIGTKVK